MTPAIKKATSEKIHFHIHEYEHDPESTSYGEEAAIKLGLDKSSVFKTLVVDLGEKKLAVAVIPVSTQLDLKLFAKSAGAKKALMADKKDAERSTGYVLGGISPIGQRKKLKTIIDRSAKDYQSIYVSAGRRGLEIELSPNDLCLLTQGVFQDISK